jgi:hypothetical protein
MPDTMTTQVKFTIEADIVSAFKARCAEAGVSMTSEVRQHMINCQPAKAVKTKALTRPMRRKAVAVIIGILNRILALESEYRDCIPEQFTDRYEVADHACEQLSEAISCLEEAF